MTFHHDMISHCDVTFHRDTISHHNAISHHDTTFHHDMISYQDAISLMISMISIINSDTKSFSMYEYIMINEI